jgi:outer membrane protein TolC
VRLSLADTVALAVRDNKDVLLQGAQVEKAAALLAQARSARNPQLAVQGRWETTRELYAKSIPSVSGQASLTQTLYQGGAIVAAIRQAESDIVVEEAVLEGRKLDTVLAAQKGFLTLLLARKLSELNKDILENSVQHEAIIRAKYSKGEAAQSDVLNARAQRAATEDAYLESLTQVDASRAALNRLLSLDPSVRVVPDGTFEYDPRALAYDEAFAKAITARPEVRENEARVKSQQQAVARARSGSQPAVSASWDYYSRSRNSLGFSPTKGWNDFNVLGLTVSWPVFDGWQTRARVEQETVALRQSELAREKVRQDIALEVRQAHLAVIAAAGSIRASEADIVRYRENLAVAQEKFRLGQVSRVALDDAQLKYVISVFNREQAIFEYLIAKSTLERAAGGTS